MKTNILKFVVISLGVVFLASCNDWLDLSPTNKVSEKVVWSNPNYVEQYVNSMYPYINIYGSFGTGESKVGLTEGCTETLKYGSIIPGTHVGFANLAAFADGGLSAYTASFYYSCWADTYPRIRRVNELIYTMNKYGSSHSEELRTSWLAQARFFRGMLYFELIKRHKDVILYDEDMMKITENKPLSTEEEGWDMVYADLMFAAENLPTKGEGAAAGRVTSGAAYALISRAMLFAERWEEAKIAAEEVFKQGYALMPGTSAPLYNKAFTSALDGNTEAILEYNFLKAGPNHSWDNYFMPGGDFSTKGGRATPTQEMVESYEKANVGGFPDWAAWHNVDGTTDTPPYSELEPRFQASILYNGATWKGRAIEPYINGKDGWVNFDDGSDVAGRSATGYYLRKLCDEAYTDYSLSSTQTWVSIRLAEVYLNHAEACYMLGDSEYSKANESLKQVRTRVGLPYSNKSGTALMDAIRQERKVELYCEGHRFWDMRRWGLADKAYSGPNSRVHGVKIEKMGAIYKYYYVDCDKRDRVFEKKLYRMPIPTSELTGNNAVKQYPEWL